MTVALLLAREAKVRVVPHDGGERIEFVAATENKVNVGLDAPEVLRVAGLTWRGDVPLLDAHNRSGVDHVLGSASLRREDRQLIGVPDFDDDAKSKRAANKVRKGSIRTVSIGYRVDPSHVRYLREGQFDGEGEARVEGPCYVVDRAEVVELSLAPVPADPDARRRAYPSPEEPPVADPTPAPAPAPEPPGDPAPQPAASPHADALATREAFVDAVRKFAPASIREWVDGRAEGWALEGITLDEARSRMHKRWLADVSEPAGAPEPSGTVLPDPTNTPNTNTTTNKPAGATPSAKFTAADLVGGR